MEQTRAHAEGASWYAVEDLAHLLAGAGRPEEAAALLEPDRLRHRQELAELLADLGRPQEAVTLLRTPLPEVPPPTPPGATTTTRRSRRSPAGGSGPGAPAARGGARSSGLRCRSA
ncbi:hypothetical protein ACQKM2_02860 [Streptomyces sp. NPDC004126]|uniref:hypothetical protein n=1 Tax=Streptomyces sp. NPDC004126 TaxID=3390695 RepID=UPI003CFC2523